MKSQIVKPNGSINLLKWKSNGKTYEIVGTRSVGRGVLDAVDLVYCVEDKTYKDYPRKKLTGSLVEGVKIKYKKKGAKIWE